VLRLLTLDGGHIVGSVTISEQTVGNGALRRVLERAGFERIGVARAYLESRTVGHTNAWPTVTTPSHTTIRGSPYGT
jgi:hypothetical protein